MRVEFFDMEERDNPLNGKKIDSAAELVRILDQLRSREPFGLELMGENGYTLTVSLAHEFGAVEHKASNLDSVYLLAVAPDSPPLPPVDKLSPSTVAGMIDDEQGVKSPEFLVGGTPTPIPSRYILPYTLLERIAVYFLETGEREPMVKWEQV